MPLRSKPENAVRYKLSQYLTMLVHGPGSVELRRGEVVMLLNDAEARQFVEAIEDYDQRRGAVSPSPG